MPSLTVIQKPIVSSNGRILTGLAARKAQLASELGLPQELKPGQMEHRIGIVFDDSGSMRADMIEDAHVGCEEFLRYCEPNKTAVCVYPMNADELSLSTNLPALAMLINGIHATGGTPLIQKLSKMLRANKLTRAIVFSDGCPQSYSDADYNFCVESKIPVDTVFIGSVIRLNIPPLTSDRRKELVKLATKYAEEGRVGIRNIRRDAIDSIRKQEKSAAIPEDEARDQQDKLQKLTNKYIAKIDELLAEKEKDISTV